MRILQQGTFFGISKMHYSIEGITIVHSSFQNFSDCPWHYHRNAHFAFTTKGTLTETHKRRKIDLQAGCLVYNHSQEPHYNSNYSKYVSALHIDIAKDWFQKYDIRYAQIEGVHVLESPVLKQFFFKIFKEIKPFDEASPIAVESLLLQAIKTMLSLQRTKEYHRPAWVNKLKDLLHAKCSEKLTLTSVATEVNIHPVYLCQQFHLFFNCSFGEYIRKLRVERAVQYMLKKQEMSLTEIAYDCGFSDQSHFIRTFKNNVGITPLNFKNLLSRDLLSP